MQPAFPIAPVLRMALASEAKSTRSATKAHKHNLRTWVNTALR